MTKQLYILTALLICFCLVGYASAADLTASSAVEDQPTTITFSGTVDSEGYLLIYYWNYGDTQTSSTSTPTTTHTYSTAGTYTVTLTVNGTLDLGEDWNISSDWDTTFGTYNLTLNVDESPAAETHSALMNNMFLVMGLVSVSLIILATVILTATLRSGEANIGSIVLVTVLLVGAAANLLIGFVIINSLSNVGGF